MLGCGTLNQRRIKELLTLPASPVHNKGSKSRQVAGTQIQSVAAGADTVGGALPPMVVDADF